VEREHASVEELQRYVDDMIDLLRIFENHQPKDLAKGEQYDDYLVDVSTQYGVEPAFLLEFLTLLIIEFDDRARRALEPVLLFELHHVTLLGVVLARIDHDPVEQVEVEVRDEEDLFFYGGDTITHV
jgi:hypothetical protein